MEVVPHKNLTKIIGNCQNKLVSGIYQGVASPYLVQWAVYRL
jgi:hypothetical protein